jgi:hypothetical protein
MCDVLRATCAAGTELCTLNQHVAHRTYYVIWEEGKELAIGFAKKEIAGVERVAINYSVLNSTVGSSVVAR